MTSYYSNVKAAKAFLSVTVCSENEVSLIHIKTIQCYPIPGEYQLHR